MNRYVEAEMESKSFSIDLTSLYLHLGGELPVPEAYQTLRFKYGILEVDGDGVENDPYIDLYVGSNIVACDDEEVMATDLRNGFVLFQDIDGEFEVEFELPIEIANIVGF